MICCASACTSGGLRGGRRGEGVAWCNAKGVYDDGHFVY